MLDYTISADDLPIMLRLDDGTRVTVSITTNAGARVVTCSAAQEEWCDGGLVYVHDLPTEATIILPANPYPNDDA